MDAVWEFTNDSNIFIQGAVARKPQDVLCRNKKNKKQKREEITTDIWFRHRIQNACKQRKDTFPSEEISTQN